MQASEPIFILGAPRSGTTFLASLLRRTRYGAPFETQFISKYFKKLSEYGNLDQLSGFKRLVSDILTERSVMQWKLQIDIDELFRELHPDVTYRRIVDALCNRAANDKGYGGWGDKTPHYIADIDIIYSLYPDSRYIYIVRDGRDVTLSLLGRDWGPNNVYFGARYWADLNASSPTLDQIEAKGSLFRLRYEDLVENVSDYSQKLFDFLETDIQVEDISEHLPAVKANNIYKWKTRMSQHDIGVFEGLAAGALERFGYELTGQAKAPGIIETFYYKLHNGFYRARHLFIINVIDSIKIRFFNKQPFSE